MWRRLPASNSALRGPAWRIRGASTDSSVPYRRIESEIGVGISNSHSSCARSRKKAFDQNRGDDHGANRRPLPKWGHIQQVKAVPDHHHNQYADQGSDDGPTSAVQAGSANHDGGNRIKFESGTSHRIDGHDLGRSEGNGDRG